MQIVTPGGTAAFAYVFRPQAAMQDGKEPQYALSLVFDKDNPKLKKLQDAIVEVATKKFGAKAKQMLEKGQLKTPLRDDKEGEDFEGKLVLTARSSEKPQVVDQDAEAVMDQMDFYSGCRARMDVWLYAYDKAGNRGVAAILNNVQKLGEGERKSGRRSASSAFADLDPEDEALL